MSLAFKFLPVILFLSCCLSNINAQTITNGDGTPLTTKYCYEDEEHEIVGNNPGGGNFTGCGVFQKSGKWYFNPVTATIGVTVFPVQCTLEYLAGGAKASKSILIYKPVVISPPLKDSFTCNGHFSLLATTLYAGAYIYNWTPSESLNRPDTSVTDGFITATQTFVITARDVTSDCMGSDTVTIELYPVPDLKVSNDTLINARDRVQLQASGATFYQWFPRNWLNNDAIANPIATPQAPVTYMVIGTNEFGCKDTAEVFIDINESLFVPNAFSPNGDGNNDIFRIQNYGYQGVAEFRVFNRLGQEVFQTMDGTKGWDGMHDNNPADPGTYFYIIRLTVRDGTVKIFKGDVALLR